jgi:hypothetical protein
MKVMDNVRAHLRNIESVPFHINIDDDKVAIVPLSDGKWKVICRHGRILEGVETMNDIQVERLVKCILRQNKRHYYLERDYDDNGYCIGFGYYAVEPDNKPAAEKKHGYLRRLRSLFDR